VSWVADFLYRLILPYRIILSGVSWDPWDIEKAQGKSAMADADWRPNGWITGAARRLLFTPIAAHPSGDAGRATRRSTCHYTLTEIDFAALNTVLISCAVSHGRLRWTIRWQFAQSRIRSFSFVTVGPATSDNGIAWWHSM